MEKSSKPICEWRVPAPYNQMPYGLRDEFRRHHQILLYYFSSTAKAYRQDCTNKAPPPIPSLSRMGFSASVVKFVTRTLGFKSLTAFQQQALPLVLTRESCLLVGPHACGKTLTYVLPIVAECWMQQVALPWSADEKPHCVIVTRDKHAVREIIEAIVDKAAMKIKVTTRVKECYGSGGKHILVCQEEDLELCSSA